jgi:cytochrome c oxidase subunit 4
VPVAPGREPSIQLSRCENDLISRTMFLRLVSRTAARSSSNLFIPARCSYRPSAPSIGCLNARLRGEEKSWTVQQSRASSEHAIANPTLAGIEKRWEAMPPQEQAELWMNLRDRMKVDWHELTLQEKKAGMSHGDPESSRLPAR